MKIIKMAKEVLVEVQKWLNEPFVFINFFVAIILIAIGLICGYIWFAPY